MDDLIREKEVAEHKIEEQARELAAVVAAAATKEAEPTAVIVDHSEALEKIQKEKEEISARLQRRTDLASAQQHEITRLKTSYQVRMSLVLLELYRLRC